ncbi:tetratricopeptide repeat protein [Nonlabens agnitus]|uniref:Cell surface protein n=1 Tax=Nonlabens agnitus TaxID=870484 RepID=A0A2S9WS40_9FLAO|nr:hypothetical protein [Nonlabens agnitus]PRP66310.1 hypothetical protein BST86_03995 [Nonlabens agnitus]
MKKIYYVTLLLLILVSCQEAEKTVSKNITDPEDYEQYLNQSEQQIIQKLKTDIQELKDEVNGDSTRIVWNARIAGKLNTLFDLTGDVAYLNESVRFRESVVKQTAIKPENAKRALAQAYIKQHQFKKADSLMSSFTQIYSAPESQLVQFDIAMELGDYSTAENLLDSLRNTSDYSYLIRAAKWNDHIGQLETTISLMERAMKLAEQSGSNAKVLWSYSNIADYYGHNGQLDKSYEYYLKTLELDPTNTYALKGIAWIAYSNDRDPAEARTILEKLQERHPIPDYNLELAEVAAFENNTDEANALKEDFMKKVSNPAYGAMYNAYKINELIDAGKTQEAVELAYMEVSHRATPETYDLLGYALLKNGNPKEALANHEEHVIGKTFEPVAQFHSALILKENGRIEEANSFKEELLETEYEMGPMTYKEIQSI